MEGHNEPCYYCKELCNSLAGSPGEWPLGLSHADEPGVVKWHHEKCINERLLLNTLESALEVLEMSLGECECGAPPDEEGCILCEIPKRIAELKGNDDGPA